MLEVSIGIACLGMLAALAWLIWKRKAEARHSRAVDSFDVCESAASSSRVSSFRPRNKKRSRGDSLRFAPELFEYRAHAIEKLESHGFVWMTNYSSIDCLHDVYGLEVCGIGEREDAVRILQLLVPLFPDWRPG